MWPMMDAKVSLVSEYWPNTLLPGLQIIAFARDDGVPDIEPSGVVMPIPNLQNNTWDGVNITRTATTAVGKMAC